MKNNGVVAISLFNGMGCAFSALKRANINVCLKISSEVNKYANIVNQKNHPDTIQMGDVRDLIFNPGTKTINNGTVSIKIPNENIILLGGSPCQSFSFAGKRKGMSTNFLGIKKWKCCVTYRGLDEPFYFKTLNRALDSVMVDIKQDIFEISEVLHG